MTLVVLRKAVTIAFGLVLLLGLLFSVFVLDLSMNSQSAGAAGGAAAATVCIGITLAYAWVLIMRGLSFVTPVLYLLSCATVGLTLFPAMITLDKTSSPGQAAETASLIVLIVCFDALIVGLAFAWAWWRPSWKPVLE